MCVCVCVLCLDTHDTSCCALWIGAREQQLALVRAVQEREHSIALYYTTTALLHYSLHHTTLYYSSTLLLHYTLHYTTTLHYLGRREQCIVVTTLCYISLGTDAVL